MRKATTPTYTIANGSSSSPRASISRSAMVRMQRILELLKTGKFPNCQRIAQELELSSKTISRDITCMRDQLRLPIEYDPQEHGYYLTEDVHALPTVQVTQGELLALMVAQKAIEQYRGTPYHGQLEAAFAKLLAPLSSMAGYAPNNEMVSFKITAPAAHEIELFDRLTRAIADQLEVSFVYRKPGEKSTSTRRVQPLHLTHGEGRWYLIADDIDRAGRRTFALGRIKELKLSSRWFERPKDFSVDGYFAQAISVRNGVGDHRVRIRFDAMASDHVRDRFWHESQELIELDGGGLELRLRLSDLLDVERLVLQWGGHAEALEPKELRVRVAKASAQLNSRHA